MAYFSIPYFNELTANQLGASTDFNPYTPANYVLDSFNRINDYFQTQREAPPTIILNPGQQPQVYYPNQQPVGPRIGLPTEPPFDPFGQPTYRLPQGTIPGGTTTPQTPPISGECTQGRNIFGGCGPILGSKPMTSDGQNNPTVGTDPSNSGKTVDDISKALTFDPGSLLKNDTVISGGLIILAVVLGIIGITSLR